MRQLRLAAAEDSCKGRALAKVLIVEDDEGFRYAAEKALEAAGFEVVAVAGSMEALDVIDAWRPDLALIDIQLAPGEPHGLALGRMIGQRLPKTPIIYTTGFLDLLRRDEVEGGKVLAKPVALDTLVEAVSSMLALS